MMFAALGQHYPEVFSKLFGFGEGRNHPTLLNHWLLACFPKSCGIPRKLGKSFGNIRVGSLTHWHVAGIPQRTQMASLQPLHPQEKAKASDTRSDTRAFGPVGGASSDGRSSDGRSYEYDYGTGPGYPPLPGRDQDHYPCWECDAENFTPWSDHALFKLAAAWSGVILSTYCSANAFFLTLDWQHFALLLRTNEG